MHTTEFLIRLGCACLCGAAIGIERQLNRKNTGLRTNALVALGATIFVVLSLKLTAEGGDVTRIVGQVVTGIGFLGAGVIIHQGANVQGINTAATIWCSAAVGCMIGAGFYMEAVICTAIIILVNVAFLFVDRKLRK